MFTLYNTELAGISTVMVQIWVQCGMYLPLEQAQNLHEETIKILLYIQTGETTKLYYLYM